MDSREVLQFVDEVVCAKTGKRLNDLQRSIIEGILKRQKYTDIAEICGCSAGHAKDVGYELLQMLSEIFGESVDKGNLKSVIERQENQNIIFVDKNVNSNVIGSGYINICPDKNQPVTPELEQTSKNKSKSEILNKLRQFGLNDEQIAEVLELPLEVVKQMNLEQ